MQINANCHLSVIAVYVDENSLTKDVGVVHSLEAAQARADRMVEEGTWPSGSSLWAIGPKRAFEYHDDDESWTEEINELAEYLISVHKPTLN